MLKYIEILLLAVVSMAVASIKSVSIVQATIGYESSLIGGEGFANGTLRFGNLVDVTPSLTTYQSGAGWQTWNLQMKSYTRFSRCWMWDIVVIGGVQADMVDLIDRNPSPSLGTGRNYSRYKPIFAIGARTDSLRFICERCAYYFTGEMTIGDFIPMEYYFNIPNPDKEILSTVFRIYGEVATPFGAASVLRQSRTRDWYGDDIWRITYHSPYCCDGILRAMIGWENGFIGFAGAEVNIEPIVENYPFSLFLGTQIPKDLSLWTWNAGIRYHPFVERKCIIHQHDMKRGKDTRIWVPERMGR